MGSQAEVLTAYSSYFVVLKPGPQVLQAVDSTAALIIALQVNKTSYSYFPNARRMTGLPQCYKKNQACQKPDFS